MKKTGFLKVAILILLFAPLTTQIFNYNISVSDGAAISRWGAACRPTGAITDIRHAVMNLTNWILGFVSIICVLIVLYGLVSGVNTIKYGLMGLVITGLAYAIVIVVSSVVLK